STTVPIDWEIFGSDKEHSEGTKVTVPPVPGVYVFEANDWGLYTTGPVVSVPLYFDDARPGPVGIEAPEWVAAGSGLPIHLSAPAAPAPLAGIRGYAVSVDGSADGAPCTAADRCAPAEVDLPGGAGDDAITLRASAEGVSYVHAVAVSGSGMRSPT